MDPCLLVTIDVESDNLWAGRPEQTFENIRQIPRVHAFCERFGVRPTYLVTYPVATSESGRQVFTPIVKSGTAEIGSHMHVWTTPPLVPLTAADSKYAPYATEIPYELQLEKMKNLTQAVGDLSGTAPRSHRAGRFGFDGRGLRVLEELGYAADTSVTPAWDWREPAHNGGLRGPDFSRAPFEPYYPDREDVSRPGSSSVLEVPVSCFISRPLPRSVALWLARLPRNNNLVRVLRWGGFVRHAWLYPRRDVDGRTLRGVAEALLAAGVPVLNVFFHSSEMAVGTSPYTPTEAEVEDSYRKLGELFELALGPLRAQSVTLSELAELYRSSRSPSPVGVSRQEGTPGREKLRAH